MLSPTLSRHFSP